MLKRLTLKHLVVCAAFALPLAGCSVNPVTGKKEFSLVSASQEVSLGEKNYLPYQQQQGGQYTVDPDLSFYVTQIGKKLVTVSDRPGLPYEFVVLNNDVPNAWALPGGKIAINRGLLIQLEDEAQLAAVIGHEIVHAAARHGASQMTRQMLLSTGMQLAGAMTQDTAYGGLVMTGGQIGAGAWQSKYGRDDEYESDLHGMVYMAKAGYDPVAAVELQELFVKMKNGKQSNWLEGLFSSHPPSQDRVARNRKTAATLGGSNRNKQQFLNAISQPKKDQPAYKKHQQAIQASSDGNLDQAISLVEQAIQLQPQEPSFYITKGQLALQKKHFKTAKTNFTKAKGLYPEYFMGHLGLGLAQFNLREYGEAKANLAASNRYLETPTAVFFLGETAYLRGNVAEAMKYYEQVAPMQNELGEKAKARLQQLNPPAAQPSTAQ